VIETGLITIARKYRGVRVLVLGATGFIGRWVARALADAGAALVIAIRDTQLCQEVFEGGISAQILEIDLLDQNSVKRLIEDIAPIVIFNLAGYGVDRSERNQLIAWQMNAALPLEIGASLAATPAGSWTGQRLVHVGSALEYGKSGGELREDTEPMPTTLYGRSKLAGTWALQDVSQNSGLPSVTARLFTVYGPGEHEGRLLPSLVDAVNNRTSIGLTDGLQKRDFTYVLDVVEGLLRLGLAHTPPGEIINLATGQLRTVRQFAETAAEELQLPSTHLQFGALPMRKDEMEHGSVSTLRLRHYTSWTPSIGIREGIRHALLAKSRAHKFSESL